MRLKISHKPGSNLLAKVALSGLAALTLWWLSLPGTQKALSSVLRHPGARI